MHKDNGPTTMRMKSHIQSGWLPVTLEESMRVSKKDFIDIHLTAGSAVVFDKRIWHRGSANLGNYNRHVLILHYYNEDTRRHDVDFGDKVLTKPAVQDQNRPPELPLSPEFGQSIFFDGCAFKVLSSE